MGVFGTWDAPVTDEAVPIDAPLRFQCIHCRLHFLPDDNGAVMPSGVAVHRECSLRTVQGGIGHLVNHDRYCADPALGPDAGLTYRASALLVWRVFVERATITEEMVDLLAGRSPGAPQA
jgi:hypothetical protein